MTRPAHPQPASNGSTPETVARERNEWLAAMAEVLPRHPFVAGAWLVGSRGRGEGDSYSDIDLVVAIDPTTPPTVLADPVAALQLPPPPR